MSEQHETPLILRVKEIPVIDRGAGVKTTPLVGKWNTPGHSLTTGMTRFEPGTAIPLHTHNVEETVMLLEGSATVVVGDQSYELEAGEVTWVPADVPHYFKNRGPGLMRIYWVYLGQEVTRTIIATGETFEHLSEADRNLATKPE
ncbi:MAG: cupin domain-containing protein [Dehalococcoidia bacterium]|nr:cupin domain-containing protein [Dehalococcoidia bacterium]